MEQELEVLAFESTSKKGEKYYTLNMKSGKELVKLGFLFPQKSKKGVDYFSGKMKINISDALEQKADEIIEQDIVLEETETVLTEDSIPF